MREIENKVTNHASYIQIVYMISWCAFHCNFYALETDEHEVIRKYLKLI